MCGIAGIFGRKDPVTLRHMLSILSHRGPDDEHIVTRDDFSLGARRLSILDTEGGRQLISNETGTVWAAHNGELYNFSQLRTKLVSRGHKLNTHCDTEVLPHLYEEHGTDLVAEIDGMFAVAIWDDNHKIGILARDRMGKKPLYYHQDGKILYFASEIKALLCIPNFKRKINLEALHYFLSYKHVPHPLSIFDGINILSPSHMLIFEPSSVPKIHRYWSPDFSPINEVINLQEEDIAEHLLHLLRQGVKRRLMSDVPIGFFLSGGIDSSLSTAIAAELSADRIKTFTLTYSHKSKTTGKELDQYWAKWTAKKFNTEHREETVEFTDFPENLRKIIACFDEPFSGVVSTYFLSQLISQHVKVALSGDAADELFGSYLSHRLAFPLANYAEYQRTGDTKLIPLFESEPDFLAQLAESENWAWRYKLLVLSDAEKMELYSPDIAEEICSVSTRKHLRHYFTGLTATDPLNRVLEAEFRSIFPDQVMTFVDRLSMAHSLEVRTPYLDTDFVSFVAGLPGHLKIKNGETKYILKKAALRYLPQEMVFRKKEGFLMPVTQWILNDLEDYVRQTLSPGNLKTHGIFNINHIQTMVNALYQGNKDYTYVNKIFSLIVFQEWYELYMK